MRRAPDFDADFSVDPGDLTRKRKQHGLKPAQVSAMLAAQGGRCAACDTTNPGGPNWHIDHDHRHCPGQYSCGRCVRGLLCRSCNLALGAVDDSTAALSGLITYLQRYEARRVV